MESLLDINTRTGWNECNWTCPFCNTNTTIMRESHSYHRDSIKIYFSKKEHYIDQEVIFCPNIKCNKMSLLLVLYDTSIYHGLMRKHYRKHWHVEPQGIYKDFSNYSIPEYIQKDYKEACLVKNLSSNAAATMARRCLQSIIRDFWEIPKKERGTLYQEIQALSKIDSEEKGKVNPVVLKAIHEVRKIGNIGAHFEDKENSFLSDVKKEEAEKMIWLIEHLIKSWYVQYHNNEQQLKSITNMRKPQKKKTEASKN